MSKKYFLIGLFLFFCSFLSFAQKEFKISNTVKEKIVPQTDYFTFYLKNKANKTNQIDEGYLMSTSDSSYQVKVFFEEYETHDSLVMKRCNVQNPCDKTIQLAKSDIEYFQHNNTTRISNAKILFGVSIVSLLTTSYFAFNQTVFENNGERNSTAQAIAVGSGMTLTGATFGLGLKLMNPKKYNAEDGWVISE